MPVSTYILVVSLERQYVQETETLRHQSVTMAHSTSLVIASYPAHLYPAQSYGYNNRYETQLKQVTKVEIQNFT